MVNSYDNCVYVSGTIIRVFNYVPIFIIVNHLNSAVLGCANGTISVAELSEPLFIGRGQRYEFHYAIEPIILFRYNSNGQGLVGIHC